MSAFPTVMCKQISGVFGDIAFLNLNQIRLVTPGGVVGFTYTCDPLYSQFMPMPHRDPLSAADLQTIWPLLLGLLVAGYIWRRLLGLLL